MKLYCFYCSRNFLNGMSRIRYITRDENSNITENVEYKSRGYEAIEGLATLMDTARSNGLTFTVEINQQILESGLYATMIVQGTAVCTAHGFDADPMMKATNPRGNRLVPPSFPPWS